MESIKCKWIYALLVLLATGCGVIWSVTNVGYDGEYQIAMAYRLMKGDKLFLEMWEPHQTSAIFPAFLMWIYVKLFRTTTGIVLYLQICGIAIRGGIAVLLYRVLGRNLERPVAFGAALLYFMISPKDYALPEFANMQVWFSALLFCCLLKYLEKKKRFYLISAAVCLCCEVLAYPSCAIVLLGVVIVLWVYSENRWLDIGMFTGVCAVLGIAFAGYFLVTIGPDTFGECISGMFALEPSHTISTTEKLLAYFKDFGKILLVLLLIGGIGYVVSRLIERVTGGKSKPENRRELGMWLWLLCCGIILLAGFFINILDAENRYVYGIILLPFSGVGFRNRGCLTQKERQIYVCGSVIGGLGFLATLLLTNLPLLSSVPYGLLTVISAVIPVGKKIKGISTGALRGGCYFCGLCFIFLLAFRCVFVRTPLTGKGQICSVISGLAIVRSGPALGIISDEAGVCIQRDSYPEWRELIRPGDKVWVVGGVVDTLGYLYEDVEVAGPSTISTPSYNEAVLDYWRLNREKSPDVIVAESYMGNLTDDLLRNQWLISFIEEEYQPQYVVDGTYWKFYFKEAR